MLSDLNPKDFLNEMLLTGNIKFEKDHLILMGRSGVLLNASILVSLMGNLMKYDRDALEKAGMDSISSIVVDYKKRFTDNMKTFKLILDVLKTSGLGSFELNFQKQNIIIKSSNSTIPQTYLQLFGKSDFPVCLFVSGAFKKTMSILFNKDYTVEEVSCIAKGNNDCTFLVEESK
ncbi:MAG: 4-vinyl reductase [Candidatus Parvarchaeum sp.]